MGKGSRQNRSVTSGKGLALRTGLIELSAVGEKVIERVGNILREYRFIYVVSLLMFVAT